MAKLRKLRVRFTGAIPTTEYKLVVNDGKPIEASGEALNRDGYVLELMQKR